jgi:hypothetical protein
LAGVVVNTGPVVHFQSKAGKPLTKRIIQIADNTGRSIDCTLWKEQAEKLPWQEGENPVSIFHLTVCFAFLLYFKFYSFFVCF